MRRLLPSVIAVMAHLVSPGAAPAQDPVDGAVAVEEPPASADVPEAPPEPPAASVPVTEPPPEVEPAVQVVVARVPRPRLARFLHGFRLGYNYWFNLDRAPCSDCPSLAQEYGLRSPHSFVIGYEVAYRMIGNSWLNVLLVGNASVAGIEQSRVLPSANLLIGAELNESFQVGVGVNVAPVEDKVTHMIAAAGWTPAVGEFYTPVHLYFIPDVDGNHRMGATMGVTW